MSNYTKSTNFATKDNLSPGNPLKIVKGAEIDTEFNNIQTAVATKTDNASANITGGSITGITDLAVADGGTGASTATAALNNLLPTQTGNANKYLQTDGTNATWDAVSLSTADITGTLPVANGGTGVTSSTGTGSVVLSNSPTLVTPALGTPASGTATNLTGLPISTGVSGLGSGVATFLGTPSSANLASAVTDETGSGALVFANSPTLVTPALGTPSALVGTNITGTASGLTAGNVTTNANLTGAVTSVGNATSLGSFSSSNLAGALTDETGSGSAVFATSPTLVTPILGTPTSATLTNATGLPISTGVSGLGTGVATALAVNTGSSGAVVVNGGALGTPSGGTATNLTGLPLSTGVTGTLPVANGGTGQTSYTDGQLLIGNSTGNTLTKATLTQGTGITITNGNGTITIAASGGGGSGDVVGPASSTDNALARFDTTTGKLLQNSVGILSDTGAISGLTDISASGSVTLSGGTANGVTYLNGSKVLTSGSALTFDGTNLGVGVTPSAWRSTEVVAQIGHAFVGGRNDGTKRAYLGANLYKNSSGTDIYLGNGFASFYQQNESVHSWFIAPSGTAGNTISFTQAMILDASGLLQIGTTTAAASNAMLTVYNPSATSAQIALQNTTTGTGSNGSRLLATGNDLYITNKEAGFMAFETSDTERGRFASTGEFIVGIESTGSVRIDGSSGSLQTIGARRIGSVSSLAFKVSSVSSYFEAGRFDSDGNLLVGTTNIGIYSFASATGVNINAAGTIGASSSGTTLFVNRTTSDGAVVGFYRAGNQVGTISVTTSATAYNTSSDYRLKNTITPMTGALAKIAQLKPVTYKWNADNSDGQGFIAHELAEVVPECVTGEKDAVDAEGNPQYQGIDTSFLVATLTAAIQEQQALIQSLKARLDAANL